MMVYKEITTYREIKRNGKPSGIFIVYSPDWPNVREIVCLFLIFLLPIYELLN